MTQYPTIVKAALEIWYDNGMINRQEPESEKLELLNKWLPTLDQQKLADIEKTLAALKHDDLVTVCCGEETEAAEICADEATNDFLNQIFDEEYLQVKTPE
ncbi:hypothetical protein EAb13_CDS0035 [Acinetobacter phage EAb13]|nr:hypothetical protein EAb13_CDS0035 [Acinetobacter phage EAb13]